MGISKCKIVLNISLREFGLCKFNLGSWPLGALELVHLEKYSNFFGRVRMEKQNIRVWLFFFSHELPFERIWEVWS